jgi:ABC-2 type transport system permease protein
MYRLMTIHFLRNRVVLGCLCLLLATGIISLLAGKEFIKRQQAAIHETTAHQEEHIARLVQYENKEMGLLLYYLKFACINPTSPLAGLAIGQRDINSSIQAPAIRGLEGQKYDTDIRNPYHLMTGHFDLSFVLLYLFPLAIIVLCFNVYSGEKEQDTWPLVHVQSNSRWKYLLQKLSIPYIFVMGILLLLYLLAALLLAIPFNAVFIGYMLSNCLYINFWFTVVLLLVSFFKDSASNAISLLSIWLLLTLLLPAAVNNYITKQYPVPESLSTMVKQRDGYHKKWDIPQDSTMAMFVKVYPQFANYKWRGEGFNWLWYYAMQHLGDADAAMDSQLFMHKLMQREKASATFSYFNPALYTQLYNENLAQSSMQNHLQFLDSITKFHEQLRLYFYPKIFTGSEVLKEDWSRFKPVYCQIRQTTHWYNALYTGLFVLVLGGAGFIRLKRKI